MGNFGQIIPRFAIFKSRIAEGGFFKFGNARKIRLEVAKAKQKAAEARLAAKLMPNDTFTKAAPGLSLTEISDFKGMLTKDRYKEAVLLFEKAAPKQLEKLLQERGQDNLELIKIAAGKNGVKTISRILAKMQESPGLLEKTLGGEILKGDLPVTHIPENNVKMLYAFLGSVQEGSKAYYAMIASLVKIIHSDKIVDEISKIMRTKTLQNSGSEEITRLMKEISTYLQNILSMRHTRGQGAYR